LFEKITVFYAAILGFVEGLTEYLPVSSTGHLILTSKFLGIPKSEGLDAFEIVIQGGALLAVIGVYRRSVWAMLQGLIGKNREGLKLFILLVIAFIPAAIAGLLFEHRIKAHLFKPVPVAIALVVGGIAMILMQRFTRPKYFDAPMDDYPAGLAGTHLRIADLTAFQALLIGLAQCLALWPGTSRSMVTIVAGMLLGFTPVAAAEFSFLLALPILSAATLHDLKDHGHQILAACAPGAMPVGLIVSFVVAAISVQFLIRYLTRHGLAVFGWYRVALAVLVLWFWRT